MLGITELPDLGIGSDVQHRASKATIGCEALEGRQLLSRGHGPRRPGRRWLDAIR